MVHDLDLLDRNQGKLADAGEYIGNLERSILLLRVETNWALMHNADLTICLRFEAKKKSKSHKCNEGENRVQQRGRQEKKKERSNEVRRGKQKKLERIKKIRKKTNSNQI